MDQLPESFRDKKFMKIVSFNQKCTGRLPNVRAMKIKKGDTVKVIVGKDKGKEGKVLAVNAKDNTVLVENVNMVTKHSKTVYGKPERRNHQQEAPLHISNVMLVVDGKATRVGFTR